jgi:predicted benzoate:H+ symporter BenE
LVFDLRPSGVVTAVGACDQHGASSARDPARRYTAAIANGLFYLAAGSLGASITGLLNAFSPELVHIIALLPTMAANLAVATRHERRRNAPMLTFLVTLCHHRSCRRAVLGCLGRRRYQRAVGALTARSVRSARP